MGPKGLSPELFNLKEAFILSIFFDSSGLLQQVGTNALEREFFVLRGGRGMRALKRALRLKKAM